MSLFWQPLGIWVKAFRAERHETCETNVNHMQVSLVYKVGIFNLFTAAGVYMHQ